MGPRLPLRAAERTRRPARSGLSGRTLIVGAVALLAAGGCGHPASEEECQTIVERIIELELKAQNVTDPAEVSKRKGESFGVGDAGASGEVLKGCVGKHITDRAIACVREATSASEITDRCLQ
jgi:hypothetical protein